MHKIESSLLDLFNQYSFKEQSSSKKPFNGDSKPLFIAYSGGLDSSVLLYASFQLLKLKLIPSVHALHVNHGIECESDDWQKHCESTCQKLSIHISSKSLNLTSYSSKVSENTARDARYEFFQSQMLDDCLIAFAHHQDDQAETLLFRLFRGTGISGAGAISESRVFANNRIIRPFLKFKKSELLEYAQQNKLPWVEDKSNQENDFSRNIIRNKLLPLIQQSWPRVTDSLAKFSNIAREQNEILLEVANDDLTNVSLSRNIVCINQLLELSKARQKNVIHYWISSKENNNYSRATNQEIEELIQQLQRSVKKDNPKTSQINVKLGDFRVRLFDGDLWLCESKEPVELEENINWADISQPLNISGDYRIFSSSIVSSIESDKDELAVRAPTTNEKVTIRRRVGGEKLKPQYRDKTCELKKIYQELKIPHWRREWLPIIYYNEEIVCVPEVFVNKEYLANKNNDSIQFVLRKHNN